MRMLRGRWFKKIEAALEYLKLLSHPIAKFTIDLVLGNIVFDNKKLMVLPFSKWRKSDLFLELKEYNEKHAIKLPLKYPASKITISILSQGIVGTQLGSRIYFSENVDDPELLARILVHEVNHFINDSSAHYDTEEEIHKEELRAYLAEELVFSNRPITRHALKEISKKIEKSYNLHPVERVVYPDGNFSSTLKNSV